LIRVRLFSNKHDPGLNADVTYADDLVILCRRGKAEEALQRLREMLW